jgi:hypothetical protein
VWVNIESTDGLPGERTVWVFDDTDLQGLDLGVGDDVLAATGLDPSGLQDLALDVERAQLRPQSIGPLPDPPADTDGDGTFEDVNGDGSVNVGDAQAIFANAQEPTIQNNPEAFDYNGDGSVNVGDAQALFARGVQV